MFRTRLAAFVMAGGLAGAAAIAQTPVWTQPPIPSRDRLDKLNLAVGWRTMIPVDGKRDGIASVQDIGGQVVVQTRRGVIACLDSETGIARWTRAVGDPYAVTHDVGFNDEIILVANTTRIYAIERANGQLRWDVDLPATPSSPPTADALAMYVNLSNGTLATYILPEAGSAIAAKIAKGTLNTGTNAATKSIGPASNDPRGSSGAAAPGSGRTVTVSTAIDNRSVTTAVQASGGRTAAGRVDIKKAFRTAATAHAPQVLWEFRTTKRIQERPVVGSRTVLVVSTGRDVFLINRKDGDKPIEIVTESSIAAPVGQFGEMAYVADRDGAIYAIDLISRTVQWRYTANSAVTAEPLSSDADLFVRADLGGLIRLDRITGSQMWQNPDAHRFMASNPKFVYAADRHGNLLVLDRGRGTRLGRLDTSAFMFPVHNERTDRIFLAAHDGSVLCLHDKAFPRPLAMQGAGASVSMLPPVAPDSGKSEEKQARPLPGSGEKPKDAEKPKEADKPKAGDKPADPEKPASKPDEPKR